MDLVEQRSQEVDSPWSAFFQRYALILKATSIAGILGLLLIALGFLLSGHSAFWSATVLEAGKVVVVTSVIGLIFEFVMHERFVERVKQQVGSVEKQVGLLDASIEHLQKTVAITSGAIESGLSAVFSDRQQAIDEIATLLSRAKRGQDLRLLGISLGDFLCPHGRLYRKTVETLTAGVNVKALLLDMSSDAAKTRAQREESSGDTPQFGTDEWLTWYHSTRCYDELKTASDVAQTYAPRFTGKREADGGEPTGRFEFRTYTLSPLCFLAILEGTMFLESYHYAGRGGEAPILKIAEATSGSGRSSRLFEIYSRHFEILWDLSTPALVYSQDTVASPSAREVPAER